MELTLQLSDRQRELLTALENGIGWIDRVDIAMFLGKNALNPHDKDELEALVDIGLVERDTAETGITEKFIYRVKRA